MLDFLKLLILTAIPTTQNQKSLAIEVLVLRQQLSVLNREKPRPKLRNGDRVPTVWFKTLHVLVFIEHARRKIVHFNISRSPCSEWAAKQLTNAFPYDTAPRFLIHDRDPRFQGRFKGRAGVMNIEQVVTARKSPKMLSASV